MKRSNPRKPVSPVLIGIALAAMAQLSYAARDLASQTQTTGLTRAVQDTSATASAERGIADQGSPLTLYLEDTNGNAFRLIQVPGAPWKFAEGWKSSGRDNSAFQRTEFAASSRTTSSDAGVAYGDPLTVFIDGPSGFTFVWNQDEGWKFVGKIADVKR